MRHQLLRSQRVFRPIDTWHSAPETIGLHESAYNRLALVGLLLLTFLAFACRPALADDQIRAVRLSNVVGNVQILNGSETQFSQAYPNMPLMQGSTLKTGEDGRAEIQFEDGSVVRLTPNSSAAMSVLTRSADGTNTEVDLLSGLSYVVMKGTANQRFVVHFNGNEVISPAPVKFRVNLDAKPSEFAVLDGSAHLSNGTAYSVDVRSGETVRFDANDASRYMLAQGVDPDSWDQWNTDRDQAMGQMAAQETREARGSGNANDPAWSDLDYYGNWYSANGSSFWVPTGAGAGWDPYGSGYWGYYGATGGYAWISGYPWGWLPYHCGIWNYYNSLGWGWIPQNCGYGWYPVSGIGYAPPRYKPLPRPNPVLHPLPIHNGVVKNAVGHPIIPVDRGGEATRLDLHTIPAPKTVSVNGQTVQLLPKTPNPANSWAARSSGGVDGRPGFGTPNHQMMGSIPVYRQVAPASAYHPGAPTSFTPRPGGTQAGGVASSGPRYSAPAAPMSSASSAGHASAPSSAGAPSGGGGHH